jgi:chromosome segregation ATPase
MQQARRRFSATATPKKYSKHNNGRERSCQRTDISTIQQELHDVEKQSLRHEVEQLREALRCTTMELSAMHDKEKELQEERVSRLELKGECQHLKRNLEQYQAENEEMLNDLLDSTVFQDDLTQKLALKEEAFNKPEESHHKVNQERDELVDKMCTFYVENGDLFYMQEKMEHLKKRARHDTLRQAAEIAELQQRLEGVSREQEELGKRNAILQHNLIKHRRASRRASADAAVSSRSSCAEPGVQVSPCDSALLPRRYPV